ncbi:hypothetical protein [Thiobacillus denitrificans]|uniref:hypothetical protein n=1 Tax=Thiobacillus denitrificans TaxID=36861 RepID=UPI000362600B|nr:hypothetical protein [Thiobacillus denitrificans]
MKAKILGAAFLGAILGGLVVSSPEFIKSAFAADGFRFVNMVTTVNDQNLGVVREEDPETKAVCYTAHLRNGNIVGFSCIKKD